MNYLKVFWVIYCVIFAFSLIIFALTVRNTYIESKRKRLQIAKDILRGIRSKDRLTEKDVKSLHRQYESIFKIPGRWSTREAILFGHVLERITKKNDALGFKPQ